MRTDEAAAELGVSKTVVFRQIKAGRLPAKKFGRDYRILREDFERFRQLKRERGRPPKGDAPVPFSYGQGTAHYASGKLAAESTAPHPPGRDQGGAGQG